jgi:hypothetical protein
MNPTYREPFNRAFTEEKYRAVVDFLYGDVGFSIPFRISETPIFLTAELSDALVAASSEIVASLRTPEYRRFAEGAIPPGSKVPGDEGHPAFLQIDFALAVGEGGRVVPQLIELQGFPSLYGFQWLLDEAYRHVYGLPPEILPYYSGLEAPTYPAVLRDVIVAGEDPESVVLLEIEPEQQKTRVDFAVTEKMLGIATVCATDVRERGGTLYYDRGGREVPIRRIYNRVIFDELERKGLRLDALFGRDLDVTWVGHPNWFWKISKYSLPFLGGRPYAPECRFVSELPEIPGDLDDYVLKPLYSFAGLGVELGPSAERLRSLEHPENYILQRRVEYAPAIETPDGPAKAEVRMMFVWKDGDDEPRLVNNLVRMTKGKMVGVDFNKDKTWIGASVAYHPR